MPIPQEFHDVWLYLIYLQNAVLFTPMVNESLLMMSNYEKMSFVELRAYVIEHRDRIEALRFLMSKRNPNSLKYPIPTTEAQMQEQMQAIRRKIDQDS